MYAGNYRCNKLECRGKVKSTQNTCKVFLSLQKWSLSLVSLGDTIMRKMLIWQLSRRQSLTTLHKEGKPQTFIAKEAGCSQSAVSKHVNRKLSGRKKMLNQRENRSLWGLSRKSILEFGWTSQGMDWGWGQVIKSTTHRRVEEFGYSCLQRRLTWAKRRRTGLLPSGPKSSFQMRASFVFHLETKVLESGGRWRSSEPKLLKVQC